jgi:TonB-dependent SusC/RagA subfamily outer membrane receptor
MAKTESMQRAALAPNFSEELTIQKQEVVLEESIEPNQINKSNVPQAYAKADFSISGEEIVRLSRTSIVNALKGRVPGFTVVGGFIRLGGPSSFMGPAATEPLLILDGLQITGGGTESILSRLNQIQPEMVERVDVIKYGGAAMYGTRGANGVIMVTTKSAGNASDNQLADDLAQHVKVMGYSTPTVFFAPDYSTVKDRKIQTDNRSTLYWASQVMTDKIGNASVTFYAADSATRYKIVVEGVSAAGDPLRGVFFIDVVK